MISAINPAATVRSARRPTCFMPSSERAASAEYIQGSEEGADPTRHTTEGAYGQRLDRFLAAVTEGVSRTRIQRWIALGAVRVNGVHTLPGYRLRGVETVEVFPLPREADQAFEPDAMPLAIVHEDRDLMILDKPAGLVVHPAPWNWRGTLMNGLLHARPDSARLPRAGIVHRLDRDTTGLLMVARSEAAYQALTLAIAERRIHRRYLAVVQGEPPAQCSIDAPIDRDPRERTRMAVVAPGRGKPAVTHVHRLASASGRALVECRLETGRTHQIRVHLASRGHPLVGDPVYGGAASGRIARQALHAWILELNHPVTGAPLIFRSPLPEDFRSLLNEAWLEVPADPLSVTRPMGGVPRS